MKTATMLRELNIAVIQLYSKPRDIAGNFARAESFLRRAASQGAHLAVLPEYHLQGWIADYGVLLGAAQQAEAYLGKYRALAVELGMAIVPGTIVEMMRGAEEQRQPERHEQQQQQQLANAAYFIGADGVVRARYRKKNLWHPERPVLTADAETPHAAFLYEPWGVRVGMLVCWDVAFPEGMRELVGVGGAQLVVCPTCWYAEDAGDEGNAVNPEGDGVFLESVVLARAFENTCGVVMCNAGGPAGGRRHGETQCEGEGDDGVKFLGRSQVAMPMLGSMGKLGAEEGMSVVRVDLDVLRIAEGAYKVRADMAKQGWHYAHTMRGARA